MTSCKDVKADYGLRSMLRLSAFMLVTAFAGTAFAASPDIVISQVYGGGGNTGATYKNDFIELFNRGTSPVSLSGWSVQYASSTGSTWTNKTNLTNVTLQPGQYYLIQEAVGAGGTVNLPTPDATGNIAMSGTAGKVALVNNTTALSCGASCVGTSGVVDFVGYGGANNYEGSPTALLSSTTAALRTNRCSDSDNNFNDFSVTAPTPRNSATALNACVSMADGACGTDNNQTLAASAPTNLCSAGTATSVNGAGHPWNWDCSGTGGGSTANCSATIQSYTLNFAAGPNGSISGTTSQTVDYGQSASAVTATPASGYTFQNWTGTNGFVTSTANPLTVTNITSSQIITANFSSATVNGACGGDNGLTLAKTAPTNLCSAGIASGVTGNGHPWNWSCSGINGGSTDNCTAAIQSYTLTFSAGTKGTLSGATPQTVDYGNSATPVSLTATSGNTFINWTGTGGFVTTTANPLTVTNLTSDMAVSANYSGLITIFHVNDTHARITPHKMAAPVHGTTNSTFEDVGGAAYMAGKMLELTTATPDSLVIDAGDISEGNPIGDMTFPGCATGGTPGMSSNCGMTKFYELLSSKLKNVAGRSGRGIDAVVVGNHDVRDASYVGNLEALQASGVPVISVNIRDIATHTPHFAPYTIVNVAGKKVGIIGYTTQSAEVGASLASTLEVVDCDWSGSAAPCHLKDYVNELRNAPNSVDIVVLGAHIGHSGMVDPNPAVSAKLLVDDGVTKLPEVSVNGHWHTYAETPAWQPESLNYKTTITESGSYITYIGELKITDTGAYVSGYNHLLRNSDITPDQDVQAFVSNLVTLFDTNAVAQGKPRAYDVVGYSNDNLLLDNEMRWWSPNEYPWSGNNPAGQWICDAIQWKAAQLFNGCDLAIETGGGVRADIPAGPVTYLQVYETFPWSDDTYVRIDMTGQDIVNFLKNTNMNAGFSRRLNVTSVDGVPTTVLFDGNPINLSQTYTVAINNYMLAHPPAGYTWPTHSTPLTDSSLVRDSLVEFMQTNHATQASAYSVGGPRYNMNTEYSGGYRVVVTMLNDSDTRPTFEDAFVRFLSATPETLARRGQGKVPADLVNEDGTINQAHHLAEQELYRSYLGFKAGALRNGDIIEVWGKGSFFDGNPEFVEQEGIYGNGQEFKIVGFDPSLAKPAFKSSIGEFWNDFHKNHYVQFLAKKTGASSVQDQSGQTITISDVTGFANKTLPGAVNDILLISGVPTMESFGLRFRCDSAVVSGSLQAASSVSSNVNPTPAGTTASPLALTTTAATSSGAYFLTPTADSQVASVNATTNYGTSTNIYIQSDNSGFGNERGWLKFDLSTIPAGSTISGATLQLWNWKSAGASLPVEVRSSTTDSWTETGINWSTQPALGGVLDTQTLVSGVTNVWYNWNVTSFVQSEFSGDKTVSVLVKAVTEDSADATAPSYGFDSKEYASNKPVLHVTTGASAATVTQVQYYYRYSANNSSWGAWTSFGTPVTTAPYSLSFSFPQGEGYYEFYSIATDSTGAISSTPAGSQTATHYTATPAYYPLVSIDNLYHKYDGTPKTVSLSTIPAGASYSVTYNGSTAAPTLPGIYTVVATATSGGNTTTTAGTLTIGKGVATVSVGNWSFTYDGTPKTVAATTTPAGLAISTTYNGSLTAPINSDTYNVAATVVDANYQGSASGTLVITPAAATITFGTLNFIADGSSKSVTATTSPANLGVTVTYNGSTTPPSAAGDYTVVATISTPNYQGSATATMNISTGGGAAAVPALDFWGLIAAVTLLAGFSLRGRARIS